MAISNPPLKQQDISDQAGLDGRPLKTEYIFIVGVSRSGTSLMRHILNQSDWIAISRENHFLGHLIGSEGTRQKFRQLKPVENGVEVPRLILTWSLLIFMAIILQFLLLFRFILILPYI